MNRYWGLQSMWQQLREKTHMMKEVAGVIGAYARMSSAARKEDLSGSTMPSQETLTHGLEAIWKLGKLEIEKMVRSVCESVMQDKEASDVVKRHRAKVRTVSWLPLVESH